MNTRTKRNHGPRTQRPRFLQLHRNGLALARSTYARPESAQRAALYLAWYKTIPGDVIEIVDRRTGRSIARFKSSTLGVAIC
jgi:hypothetical protein